MQKKGFLMGILAALALFIYAPTLSNEFLSIDDGLLIYENPAVQIMSMQTIGHIFSSYDPELYIPLTLLSYQLEHALFEFQPYYYHATNMLLHIGNSLLLFAIVTMLAKKRSIGFLCAALFAVHPIHVEAVAWAAARKDLLSTLFFLSSLYFYLQFKETRYVKDRTKSIGSFVLALLSKATVVVLPVVLLLVDWKEGGSVTMRNIKQKMPYFVLSILFGVIALGGKSQYASVLSVFDRILLFCKSSVFALQKIFVPVDLTMVYQQATPVSITAQEFWLPVLIIIALTAVCIRSYKQKKSIAFGLGFFFLAFAPIIATFAKEHYIYFFSDRYAYIPSMGIFFIVATLIVTYGSKQSKVIQNGIHGLLTIIILTLAVLSSQQAQTWKNDQSVFEQVIKVYPDNAVGHHNLGIVLMEQGLTIEAEELFMQAVQLDTSYPYAYANLADIAVEKGDMAQELSFLQFAVDRADQRPILSMEDLALYYYLGQALEQRGSITDAIVQYEKAAEKAPHVAQAQYNAGVMYNKYDRKDEALEAFRRTVELAPKDLPAQYQLAAVAAGKGNVQEATRALEVVVSINPQYEEAAQHLAKLREMAK